MLSAIVQSRFYGKIDHYSLGGQKGCPFLTAWSIANAAHPGLVLVNGEPTVLQGLPL